MDADRFYRERLQFELRQKRLSKQDHPKVPLNKHGICKIPASIYSYSDVSPKVLGSSSSWHELDFSLKEPKTLDNYQIFENLSRQPG